MSIGPFFILRPRPSRHRAARAAKKKTIELIMNEKNINEYGVEKMKRMKTLKSKQVRAKRLKKFKSKGY